MRTKGLIKALFDFPLDAEIMGNEDGDLEIFEAGWGRKLAVVSGLDGKIEVTYFYGCTEAYCLKPMPDLGTNIYRKINRRCTRHAAHPGSCDDRS